MFCSFCGQNSVKYCPCCNIPFCASCGKTAIPVQPHSQCMSMMPVVMDAKTGQPKRFKRA